MALRRTSTRHTIRSRVRLNAPRTIPILWLPPKGQRGTLRSGVDSAGSSNGGHCRLGFVRRHPGVAAIGSGVAWAAAIKGFLLRYPAFRRSRRSYRWFPVRLRVFGISELSLGVRSLPIRRPGSRRPGSRVSIGNATAPLAPSRFPAPGKPVPTGGAYGLPIRTTRDPAELAPEFQAFQRSVRRKARWVAFLS